MHLYTSCIYMHKYICTSIYINAYTYIYKFTCKYIYLYVNLYIYTYVYNIHIYSFITDKVV